MPWTADDAHGHTHHADTDKKRRQWADVANSAKNSGKSDAQAIREANAAVHKMANSEIVDKVMAYLTAVGREDIANLLEQEVSKESIPVGDAHVATALGNQPGSKKVSFAEALDAAKTKTKKEDKPDITKGDVTLPMVVTKMDIEQQKVMGWASVVMRAGKLVIDKQGDVILPDDLEKAAHDFTLHCRIQGDMHKKGPNGQPLQVGRLIESIVFTPEKLSKGLSAVDPETGEQLFGWFVGFKVDDPRVWDAHKRGERPEFSMGGRGVREEFAAD